MKQIVDYLENEKWVQLPYYDGRYYISNKGRMKSRLRNGKEFILKTHKTNSGYDIVRIYYTSHKSKEIYIHRLVAQAFIPNPDNLREVNHIDGNKLNNCVENLEWCSRSMNEKHAYVNGMKTQAHRRKPILQFDKFGRFVAEYKNIVECTTKTGINYRNIWCVCNNKQYRHTAGGYIFVYKSEEIGDKK